MKILHLEDNPGDADLVSALLTAALPGCAVTLVATKTAFLAALAGSSADLVLSDFKLPGFDGLEALALVRERAPDIPFVFLSGTLGEERAIEAVQAGAADYVLKDRMKRLVPVIQRALRDSAEQGARRRIEAALQASHQRQTDLINSVDGIVWEADATTFAFTFVSAQAERLLGYPCQQWLDEPTFWRDHLHPEDREAAVRYCLDRTARLESHQFEYRMLAADGRSVWLRDHVQVQVEHGRAVGLRGILFDITARKATEAQLQEREARYRGIFDNEPECIKLLDREGRLLEMNAAGLQMIEADSIEQMRHHCIYPLVAEEYRAAFQALTERVLRGESGTLEFDLIGLHGGRRTLETNASPLRDAANAITALLGVTRDITARKESERRLREQAEALNKARDAIIVASLDGQITFWNEGAERIIGWTASEAVGKTAEELFGAQFLPQLTAAREAVAAQDAWQGELKLNHKDGRPLVLDLRMTLIRDAAGRPKSRLSIGTDITEKKKLEEQFLRVQRLESIGMLAAGIAHDLNNVLTPILMAAPMLRVRAADPRDLRLLQTLEHSAERGAGLVRQILAFAHGTGGEPKLIQVKHLARDIVEMIQETFPKNIELEQHIPNDLWPISANPTQIHQVLLNLCVNARDAMPKGGTLSLSTVNRRLDEAQAAAIPGARPGAFVLLEVRDTGTGIPPEALAHIWEPFFTTKGEDKGTGLGLSTVRGIVENHRGFITLQTAAGTGTTFQVYLPAAETEDATAGSVHPFLPRGNGELILLVDDEVNNRDVTHATLARYGYRVLVAGNGTEAIALFVPRREEIRLVITDLNMPNLDGGALARILLRLKPDLRILAISGLVPKPVDVPADFLAKPFKTEALLFKVHALLHPAAPPATGGT